MLIDAATRNNLELTRTLSGEKRGSLLNAVDLTITAAGGRLMAERLANPLADPVLINARLDEVAYSRRSERSARPHSGSAAQSTR